MLSLAICRWLLVCLISFVSTQARSYAQQSQSPLPNVFGHTFDEINAEFDKAQLESSKPTKANSQPGQVVLLDESKLRYDERGAATISHRRIWKVTQRDVGDMGILEQEFSPWYQEQPRLRATIYEPNGKRYELSDDDVSVSPAQTDDRTILSDNLIVRAALPGVKQGAIIEELVETVDKTPFFATGTMQQFPLTTFVPLSTLVIEIDRPKHLPLVIDYGSREVESQVVRTQNGDREIETLTIAKPTQLLFDELESYAPLKQSQFQQVVVTTGRSWSDIAVAYNKTVEGRMEGMDWESLVGEVVQPTDDTDRKKALACIAWIKESIRYTGVSLGDASIVPSRPLQVCTRRFGDCKDQATLLVGMLRHLKIESHVTLVNSFSNRIPQQNVPSLNSFNHAIVQLTLDGQEYFVDTTSHGSTLRFVPDYLQGKSVLIVSPESNALTQIPIASSQENSSEEIREVHFAVDGLVRLNGRSIQKGYFAVQVLENMLSESNEDREKRVNEQYQASAAGASFRIIQPVDSGRDLDFLEEVSESSNLPTDTVSPGVFRYDSFMRRMIQDIPYAQIIAFDDNNRVKTERKRDVEIRLPYSQSRTSTFFCPDGHELSCQEAEVDRRFGPIHLTSKTTKNEDGTVTVSMKVEVEAGLLTAEETTKLAVLAHEVEEAANEFNSVILCKAKGESKGTNTSLERFQAARRRWETLETGEELCEYVIELASLAQVEEALRITQLAIEQKPMDGAVYRARGLACLYDPAGREVYPGWDREGALSAFREAIRLQPDNWTNYYLLNSVLTSDENGLPTSDQVLIAEALATSTAAEKVGKMEGEFARQVATLMATNSRFNEAISLAKNARLRDVELAVTCTKHALDSRWSEIEAVRTQIGKDESMIELVRALVLHYLMSRQSYDVAQKFLEIFESKLPDAKKISAYLPKRFPLPATVNRSVSDTLHHYLNRILVAGDNTKAWSDIVANPGDASPATVKFLVWSERMRETLRKQRVTFERVNDYVNAKKVRIEGDDDMGYRCRVMADRSEVTFFVVKENNEYKMLLEGEESRNLFARAKPFIDNGDDAKAIQLLEWALANFTPGQMLSPESAHPVKILWSSARKKDATFARLVYEAFQYITYGDDWTLSSLRMAISEEKSKLKRVQLQRCVLMGMYLNEAPEYGSEAAAFIEANKGFWIETARLVYWYKRNGKTEESDRLFASCRDEIPEVLSFQIEEQRMFLDREYDRLFEKRLERMNTNSTSLDTNSMLWTSLFAHKTREEHLTQFNARTSLMETTGTLHTLAIAEADSGIVDNAAQELQYLVGQQGDKINNIDWLIFGAIAQKCGLHDAARRYYERVTEKSIDPGSSYELAQLRIKELDAIQERGE